MKIHYPQWTSQDGLECSVYHDGCELVEAILVTAEICGRILSPAAAETLAGDLADFDEAVILDALARCRMELQGPLRISEILSRIRDGRPDADEAWAMMPQDELASVVWTDEMAKAWGIVMPLLEAGDTGKRPGGRADLGGKVGERREIVADEGRLRGETAARQLHPVAGVAGEPDHDGFELLDGFRHVLRL